MSADLSSAALRIDLPGDPCCGCKEPLRERGELCPHCGQYRCPDCSDSRDGDDDLLPPCTFTLVREGDGTVTPVGDRVGDDLQVCAWCGLNVQTDDAVKLTDPVSPGCDLPAVYYLCTQCAEEDPEHVAARTAHDDGSH